ncbi:hypothetical protein ACWPKO_14480 [Coraliomargarita sp. W4R53]
MTKVILLLSAAVLSFLTISCTEPVTTTTTTTTHDELKSNPGRDLVMDSIQAHGGTEKWYNNGLLQYRWKHHRSDKGSGNISETIQTVDPRSLDVMHEVPGQGIHFGQYQGQYWISPQGTQFSPPVKFWALTPYYFIGIPFVFNDENAIFELLPDLKAFEGEDYAQVKVTYTQEAGDSPDDYYVLLIDPETKLTRGAYYIVTHSLVAPNGPGPEKFISLDNLVDVDGIQIASGLRTFPMKDGMIGEQMRFTEVSGLKYLPTGSVDLGIPSPELILE